MYIVISLVIEDGGIEASPSLSSRVAPLLKSSTIAHLAGVSSAPTGVVAGDPVGAAGGATCPRARRSARAAAGTRAALEGLKVAEGPQDVARLARLAETKGGKTRAILKLAGRGAFALTALAFDLFSWVFAAVWALFGLAAAVKRITERTTERYLRWRKGRARALVTRLAGEPGC